MRQQLLVSILNDLTSASEDIEASAVISTEGLMIASVLTAGSDEGRVGAMTAAMLSLGERTASELGRGDLEQVLVKGSKGYVLMLHAGEDAVLLLLVRPQAKLGLIFLDAKRAAENLVKIV
jgi:predicted regulator of Ras-like GTPase activity (Roadblock/LC7/MglB family)